MPAITGIHHLSLTVRDLGVSEEFYSKVFGFVRVLELDDVEGRGTKCVLAHPDSGTIVGFTAHKANDGSAFSPFRTGLDHLSFGVATRADLDAWANTLDELGIAHSDIRSTGIGDLLTLNDPDEVQIELWASPA